MSLRQSRPHKPRRDFGLRATARALYSGPQPVCARRLLPVRLRKPRAWPHIFTIRLLYIDNKTIGLGLLVRGLPMWIS